MFERETIKTLRIKKADWQKKVATHYANNEQKLVKSSSHITIEPVYTPVEISDLSYEQDLGFPGEYPFTRGVDASMYRNRQWGILRSSTLGGTAATNKRFRTFLQQGDNVLPVNFDLPTQIGIDSDHPLSYGEVGRVGVVINSLADMEELFEDIPLAEANAAMNINAPAAVILAMYLALAEKRGVPWEMLNGTIQNDVLKEYVARGTYILPPHPALRLVTDTMAFCAEHVPKWNTILISGYHIREAGSTAVQEVAFTIANGIAYVEAAIMAGLEVDSFAPRLVFYFSAHQNFFEEVAKLRAARRLWAKIMRERFAAQNHQSWMMRIHAETAGSTLMANMPDVNTIRVAYQALSAVLGGTQSLYTSYRDSASPLPNPPAERVALNTHKIIANEIGVADTVDPLGGSYYIESLTTKIEEEVNIYLDKIDALGGAIDAIENGFFQQEIQQSAYLYQKQLESRDSVLIGQTNYKSDYEEPSFLPKVDPLTIERQVARLHATKNMRDQQQVFKALQKLRHIAQSSSNVMPAIIDAVRVYATLGEICAILRDVFGIYKEPA